MSGVSEWALFIGRLHPVLVHLPIGLILLLVAMEIAARSSRFREANANAGFVLAVAVPLAGVTLVCGLLLSQTGGYDQALLRWHKWTGIITALACGLAALLYWLGWTKPYRVCLFVTAAVLLVSGHFGGSLTHGKDYLVRYAPAVLRSLLTPAEPGALHAGTRSVGELTAFGSVVEPILKQNCIICHGPEKAKGGLRLDSLAGMLKGGESGPGIQPGKPDESLLLNKVMLPPEDENHMPPDGKPQPSEDDIALLEWWIEAGSPAIQSLGDLKPPPRIERILHARLGIPSAAAN